MASPRSHADLPDGPLERVLEHLHNPNAHRLTQTCANVRRSRAARNRLLEIRNEKQNDARLKGAERVRCRPRLVAEQELLNEMLFEKDDVDWWLQSRMFDDCEGNADKLDDRIGFLVHTQHATVARLQAANNQLRRQISDLDTQVAALVLALRQ